MESKIQLQICINYSLKGTIYTLCCQFWIYQQSSYLTGWCQIDHMGLYQGQDSDKRMSRISQLASLSLVLHSPMCRAVPMSFLISHKGNFSGNCCWISVFGGDGGRKKSSGLPTPLSYWYHSIFLEGGRRVQGLLLHCLTDITPYF